MNADVPAGLLAFYGGGSQTGSIAVKQQVDQSPPATSKQTVKRDHRHHHGHAGLSPFDIWCHQAIADQQRLDYEKPNYGCRGPVRK